MSQPSIFIIEGLDRLGKSTLIEGIQDRLGAFTVVHSGKPPVLKKYAEPAFGYGYDVNPDATPAQKSQALYQRDYFVNAFKMIQQAGESKIIFDRLHLGEMVYSPLYRNITPHAIMTEEKMYLGRNHSGDRSSHVRLILLTENFNLSKHFVSDGESFDDSRRADEQRAFHDAFDKSAIMDKRVICVTGEDGNFKDHRDILLEALV